MTCASSRTEALLEALQDVLQGERWSDAAVEDFLVLMLLEAGIDASQIGEAGEALFVRFLDRVAVDANAPSEHIRTEVEAYFERNPPPQGLTAAWTEQCRRWVLDGRGDPESAAVKLGQTRSWRPVNTSSENSVFRWRLRFGAKALDED